MRRWHEIAETHRCAVLDILESEAASAEAAATRGEVIAPGFAGDAEAFRVAIAVLEAVAAKGERIANGEAVNVYGTLTVNARRRAEDY